MPHCNSKQFSIKQSLTGKLIVMVRYTEADVSPAMWTWGDWRYADIGDLPAILAQLTKLEV